MPEDPVPPVAQLWQIPLWPEAWAAAALNLTIEQIQAYRYKKGLPSTMLGKHPYYLRDSVLAWFAENERGRLPED